MAFSLEAALVVPLSIAVWAGLLAMNAPAYQRVEHSGRQLVDAVCFSLENQHLYRTKPLAVQDGSMTALQVSPQSVLEICSLIQDDGRLIGRMLGCGADQGEAQSSGDAADVDANSAVPGVRP
jgi:hypothetical protein